jgi:hypothetical protein
VARARGVTTGGPRKPAIRALLALAACAMALLAVEGACRAWLRLRGKPHDRAEVETRLANLVDPIRAFMPLARREAQEGGSPAAILHPYTGAEMDHDSGGVLRYFREWAKPGDFTVVIVGGSAATLVEQQGSGDIRSLLAADDRLAGRRIVVLDYAHAGYKAPQQATRLAYLLSFGYRPDVVVNLDGFNEVALAFENRSHGTHPLYPSGPVWGAVVRDYGTGSGTDLGVLAQLWLLRNEAEGTVERARAWRFAHSALLSRWTLWRLKRIGARRLELQKRLITNDPSRTDEHMRRQVFGPDLPTGPVETFNLCLTAWYEGSLSLHALCSTRGIAYLHALQPTLFDAGSKPMTPQEERITVPHPAWRIGPLHGYPRLRELGQDLLARGVHFLDLSRLFADHHETIYYDPCHYLPEGCRLIARRLAETLRDEVLPALPPAAGR